MSATTPIIPDEAAIKQALHYVVDPELGINIVDLGLVYEVAIKDRAVNIKMTMTTPACPMGSLIQENAKSTIREQFPGVESVNVELVWEPAWEPEMMTEAAKQQLGW